MLNNRLREKDKEELIHIIRGLEEQLKEFEHEDIVKVDARGSAEGYSQLGRFNPGVVIEIFSRESKGIT